MIIWTTHPQYYKLKPPQPLFSKCENNCFIVHVFLSNKLKQASFENWSLGKKRRLKVVRTYRKFGGRSGGQKPSVTNLSQKHLVTSQGCYRHYSVSFHGKGMTVQCRPAVQSQLYKSLKSGNGTKISDKKWCWVKSKYLENKKW